MDVHSNLSVIVSLFIVVLVVLVAIFSQVVSNDWWDTLTKPFYDPGKAALLFLSIVGVLLSLAAFCYCDIPDAMVGNVSLYHLSILLFIVSVILLTLFFVALFVFQSPQQAFVISLILIGVVSLWIWLTWYSCPSAALLLFFYVLWVYFLSFYTWDLVRLNNDN